MGVMLIKVDSANPENHKWAVNASKIKTVNNLKFDRPGSYIALPKPHYAKNPGPGILYLYLHFW